MAGEDWSDAENDAIVADYFAMLDADEAGRDYNKAEHNRALQKLTGRGRGSIEYKHQNISAVLRALGEAWVTGYKPAVNYQAALEDAVARWLNAHPDWVERTGSATPAHVDAREAPLLETGVPPTLSNQRPPQDELDQIARVARRFDVVERDARNRALGKAGSNASSCTNARRSSPPTGKTSPSASAGSPATRVMGQDMILPASGPTAPNASSRSRPPTAGTAPPSTSPATNWRCRKRTATPGGSCACGISHARRKPLSLPRRWSGTWN